MTQVARRYPRSPSGRRAPNRVWSPPAANSHHLTAVALLNTLLHCYTIAHCSSTHFTQCTLNTPYWLLPNRCQVCILIRFSCCIASHYCGKGTTQNRSASSLHLTIGIGFAAQGSTVLIVCAAGCYCGAPQIVSATVTPCSTETQCAVMLL